MYLEVHKWTKEEKISWIFLKNMSQKKPNQSLLEDTIYYDGIVYSSWLK